MKRVSYLAHVAIAMRVLVFVCLTPSPLFASDSVPPAEIQKVVVPGTHPLDASAVDLAKHGYEEQEYYASGVANRYRIKNPLETATLVDSGHPYKTRIVVRKPAAWPRAPRSNPMTPQASIVNSSRMAISGHVGSSGMFMVQPSEKADQTVRSTIP